MYLIGSPQSHRIHVIKFVQGTGFNALVFDYGLAPENPFPKGLNDALEAYDYLLHRLLYCLHGLILHYPESHMSERSS
jgi:acetyl esterase/lipase